MTNANKICNAPPKISEQVVFSTRVSSVIMWPAIESLRRCQYDTRENDGKPAHPIDPLNVEKFPSTMM